jgi:hypothetical protein
MIQIRWKSSDLVILETHPLVPGLKFVSSTPTPSGNPIGPTGVLPSPTRPVVNEDSPSGLSTGAKAGIGAGVAAAVLLLGIALTVFFIKRYRSNRLHPAEIQVEVGDPSPSVDPRLVEKPTLPVTVTSHSATPEVWHSVKLESQVPTDNP